MRSLLNVLLRRYKNEGIPLPIFKKNVKSLVAFNPIETSLGVTSQGELQILATKWGKALFCIKNLLTLGAYNGWKNKVVLLTFIYLSLEFHNPFNKKVLSQFIERKVALLERLSAKFPEITELPFHIESFKRTSLLQQQIIETMEKALHNQKEPPLVKEVKKALEIGIRPTLSIIGLSGAYWMRNEKREIVGLFKPFDEEIKAPNNPIGGDFLGALGQRVVRRGVRVGESPLHEVAAFLVDQFLGLGIVPRTYFAAFSHSVFCITQEKRSGWVPKTKLKLGSFQEYVEGFFSLKKIPKEHWEKINELPLLILLDLIIGNLDRNLGNILINEENKLAAVDHGLSFPDATEAPSTWYWHLLQEKKVPNEILSLLKNFPFEKLKLILNKKCFISLAALARMKERMTLFTLGAERGLSYSELASLLSEKYLFPLQDLDVTLEIEAKKALEHFIENPE